MLGFRQQKLTLVNLSGGNLLQERQEESAGRGKGKGGQSFEEHLPCALSSAFFLLILTSTLWIRYCHSHFTDEATEAQ